MTKYIQGKDGKFAGSIGDGKTDIPSPSAVPSSPSDNPVPSSGADVSSVYSAVYDVYQRPQTRNPNTGMTPVDQYAINDVLDVMGYGGEAVRTDYSGTNMRDMECIGFVVAQSDANYLVDVVREEIGDDMADIAKQDSMGRSTIVYFPGYYADGWTYTDPFAG